MMSVYRDRAHWTYVNAFDSRLRHVVPTGSLSFSPPLTFFHHNKAVNYLFLIGSQPCSTDGLSQSCPRIDRDGRVRAPSSSWGHEATNTLEFFQPSSGSFVTKRWQTTASRKDKPPLNGGHVISGGNSRCTRGSGRSARVGVQNDRADGGAEDRAVPISARDGV